ncbi:MAG: hypothetical protein XXXJIFNMEKO3_00973 [Candidatus Erwinia impunctatus]|nr:hypothetical protein XXXJIFNMEKO_00973 [Culicoides impunctatus]
MPLPLNHLALFVILATLPLLVLPRLPDANTTLFLLILALSSTPIKRVWARNSRLTILFFYPPAIRLIRVWRHWNIIPERQSMLRSKLLGMTLNDSN